MDTLEPAHLVCALLTLERFLVEAHVYAAVALRSGRYEPDPLLDVLRQLQIVLRAGVCSQTCRLSAEDLPPLLPLINQLPAHMQMQLEQAIEAERQGEASHAHQEISPETVLGQLGHHATSAALKLRLQSAS